MASEYNFPDILQRGYIQIETTILWKYPEYKILWLKIRKLTFRLGTNIHSWANRQHLNSSLWLLKNNQASIRSYRWVSIRYQCISWQNHLRVVRQDPFVLHSEVILLVLVILDHLHCSLTCYYIDQPSCFVFVFKEPSKKLLRVKSENFLVLLPASK